MGKFVQETVFESTLIPLSKLAHWVIDKLYSTAVTWLTKKAMPMLLNFINPALGASLKLSSWLSSFFGKQIDVVGKVSESVAAVIVDQTKTVVSSLVPHMLKLMKYAWRPLFLLTLSGLVKKLTDTISEFLVDSAGQYLGLRSWLRRIVAALRRWLADQER